MRFHRFPSVFRYTLGAGTLALFASLVLATAPMPIAPPSRAVAAVSPPPVGAHRSGRLQAAPGRLPAGRRGHALPPRRSDNPYALMAGNWARQEPAIYGRKETAAIAPVINFFGGNGTGAHGIAVDSAGNVYVTGLTSSADFPWTPGAFQTAFRGVIDAYVMKFDNSGSLVYSTYLGGSDLDIAYGIAVDSSGSAYVVGTTASSDFPVTVDAFQPTQAGCDKALGGTASDGFVSKLSPDGSRLVYSTYLGGTGCDAGYAIAVNSSGEAYVTGYTNSVDFPLASPLQVNLAAGTCGVPGAEYRCTDSFVTKLAVDGSSLVYSTYLGGSTDDYGDAVAVDVSGNAYVAGTTQSPDFPASPGAFQTTYGPAGDAFIAKLDPTGGSLVFSTYLGGNEGGNGSENGMAIAVDAAGHVYVAGTTQSTNFPTVNAFQPTLPSQSQSGFVSKLSPDGASLLYSTYLGGSDNNDPRGMALDSQGGLYVVGSTFSTDFPTVSPFQSQCAGGGGELPCYDMFLFHLNRDDFVDLSSYLGGSGNDSAHSVALDSQDSVYLAGASDSPSIGSALATGVQSRSVGTIQAPGTATKPKSARQFSPMLLNSRSEYVAQADGLRGLMAKLTFVGPLASLSRAGVDFGAELVGTTSAAQTIALQNTGDQSLFISGISLGGAASGDFAETNDCGASLAATASCTISVTFTPTAVGARGATLTVTDNASGSPHTVALAGTGSDFALSSDPTSRTVTAGQSATYTLSVAPVSGFNQAVALSCTKPVALTLATCAVSPASVTPDGTNAATVTVTVTTTARGMAPPGFGGPRWDRGERRAPLFGGHRPPLQLPLQVWLLALAMLAAVAAMSSSPQRSGGEDAAATGRDVPEERLRGRLTPASLLAASLLLALLWAACGGGGGGGGGNPGTPLGTYTLTVTGTVTTGSGNLSHGLTLTLKVN